MMMTVVIIYGVCWLPLHTITLVGEYHPSIYTFQYIQPIWIMCHWLAMSNSCYNPIVYCWMNVRFRAAFARICHCCPCIGDSVALLETAHLQENKARWNYTCVYTMNLRNRPGAAQFIPNGVHRSLNVPRSRQDGRPDRQRNSSSSGSSSRFPGDQVMIPMHHLGGRRNRRM